MRKSNTELMLNELYTNSGIDKLIELAAEIIGNPVCLISAANKIISCSSDIRTAETYMRPIIENSYLPRQELARMHKGKFWERLFAATEPYISMRDETQVLLSPIRLHGELFAYLASYNFFQSFSSESKEDLAMITKIITIELQKSRIFRDDYGSFFSSQLLDILEKDEAYLLQQTSVIKNWIEKEYSYLLFIEHVEDNFVNDNNFRVLVSILRESFAGDIVAKTSAGIVILLTDDTSFEPGSAKYEEMLRFLTLNNLQAGISNRINDLHHLHRHYAAAQDACKICSQFMRNERIIRYSDVSFFVLLSVASKSMDIKSVCYPPVLALLEYDKKKNTDYYTTICTYLESSKNATETANTLNIHKNTLFYRISKAETIMGIDLSDSEMLFKFMMSKQIIKYLGAYDPEQPLP